MHLIKHPDEFKQGVRILMRTLRSKDGGKGGDRAAKKVITDSREKFDEALQYLIGSASPNERIYSTADARDWNKAIRNFKRTQLDADYANDRSRFGFYRDSFNRVVSSLQQPTARATSLFLFDCDDLVAFADCLEAIQNMSIDVGIHSYQTKNGGHIITRPFEYPKLLDPKFHPFLQKNAMMLWAY